MDCATLAPQGRGDILRDWVEAAQKRAGLEVTGARDGAIALLNHREVRGNGDRGLTIQPKTSASVVELKGIEPLTYALRVRRSVRLS